MPMLAVHVRGDAFLLQQAVLNLLDNAIEFSPRPLAKSKSA